MLKFDSGIDEDVLVFKEKKMADDTYRQMLVQQECESSHLLDNSITLVSTGALVVSLSFIKDFTGHIGLIKVSWVLLLLSIAMQMFSHWTSERAFQRQIELYDSGEHEKKTNVWTIATRYLNYGLRATFGLGLLMLVIYGFLTIK